MTLLERINGPEDLKDLTQEQLSLLAAEIRDVLVETVTRTSGHLGPNLGVVELTIALHRVFDSPKDKVIFDTGHQSYVHKLLTGRHGEFHTLRQTGGLSGYPSRAESEHDLVENSHASTSLSYADGMAKAYKLRGEHDRTVVAVIGDGALTGGMAWEALNNIAVARDSRLVIVVNDNGRSYQPTIGGLASHLSSIRVSQRYEHVLDLIKTTVTAAPIVGSPLFGALHGAKKGLKDFLQPQVLFEDLGIKYIGPIDGHDEETTEHALRQANEYGGPVLVHVITRKGFGYALAEQNEEDCLHQVPGTPAKPAAANVTTANVTPAKPAAPKRGWTDVFAAEMVAIGGRRPDVVAITAAMLHPVGLAPFKQAYPDRVYDAGIAEQHAMTMAAGLAMAGLHPVVSIYATFLNRAFDQLLMDVALHKLPVTRDPGPGRRHRPGRRVAQRHVGRLDPPGRARAWRSRHRATATGSRSCSTRPSASATAPRSSATRRAPSPPRSRRSASSARWTSWRSPAPDWARTCCCSAPARWPSPASRSRAASPTTASASRSSTRAGSSRSTRPSSRPRGSTAWSRWSRTTAGSAGSVTRWRGCCATMTSTSRSRRSASRRSSSPTARATRSSKRPG